MKQYLEDYGIFLYHISLKCNNTSAINLTKNLVLHSKIKHIEILHNFIRDQIARGDCTIECVNTNDQLTFIFNKHLSRDIF